MLPPPPLEAPPTLGGVGAHSGKRVPGPIHAGEPPHSLSPEVCLVGITFAARGARRKMQKTCKSLQNHHFRRAERAGKNRTRKCPNACKTLSKCVFGARSAPAKNRKKTYNPLHIQHFRRAERAGKKMDRKVQECL